jgi:hypothetical protein
MSVRDPNPVNARNPKRVAIVIANPAVSTTTGWPVGSGGASSPIPGSPSPSAAMLSRSFRPTAANAKPMR